jgi:hypothetical protein
VLDLRERQSESAPLLDEIEHVQYVTRKDPIAGCGSAWRRQDTARLIEPQRLAADAAALDHFTDSHGVTVNPAPWGRVKW